MPRSMLRPSSAIVVVGLGLVLAACRPVPATIDVDGGAPPSKPSVFVEREANPPAVAEGGPIAADYVNLYTCWFEHPYDYMFEDRGQALEIDGRRYGMLMAGIHGILYYGHLNECAGRLTGQEPRSYSDIGPIEALAKVPATVDDPTLPFASVNPAFVDWARAELLPPSEQLIGGIPAQIGYERVFQRFFRSMATSAAWLVQTHTLDAEATIYLNDVRAGADGIDWLEQRYASIPITDAYPDGTMMTGPMAAGFWLRRELDGSLPSCWHTLVDVLARYDATWLAELETRYPTGVASLSNRPDPFTAAP